jgi:hypothetical protein
MQTTPCICKIIIQWTFFDLRHFQHIVSDKFYFNSFFHAKPFFTNYFVPKITYSKKKTKQREAPSFMK